MDQENPEVLNLYFNTLPKTDRLHDNFLEQYSFHIFHRLWHSSHGILSDSSSCFGDWNCFGTFN